MAEVRARLCVAMEGVDYEAWIDEDVARRDIRAYHATINAAREDVIDRGIATYEEIGQVVIIERWPFVMAAYLALAPQEAE